MHYIQKYILDKLIFADSLRNRDMRPPNTESNLYQYHLKRLIDSGYVEKQPTGYTLSTKGLQYADRHSSDLKDRRLQPKLVTILLLENEAGELLLVKRQKQPFIGLYNLPSGKIHEGESLFEAAQRELAEKAAIADQMYLSPSGTVHLTIKNAEYNISESFGFIMKGRIPEHTYCAGTFMNLDDNLQNTLMPGVTMLSSGVKLCRHQEVTIDI